jgi:3-methylfumaryl-CoA hydratase
MMTPAFDATGMQDWIGRSMSVADQVTAFPINALSATLDREDPQASDGTAVPPLWHWLYFLPIHRSQELRHDGHVKGGEFMPPIPLPRRVWAGSRFEWNLENPLKVGDRATRVSRIASITSKSGRTGELAFVKVVHEFGNASGLCLTNEHLSAFRGAARPDAPTSAPEAAETKAAWHRAITPDELLLFRYSALTFNPHRIHYDWPYATGQEGYPTLLVHGPLIATLLADLLRRNAPDARVRSLELKSVLPSFVRRTLHLRGEPEGEQVRLWAADDTGALTMTASAQLAKRHVNR